MTPLAYQIASRQTLPIRKRPPFKDYDGFLMAFSDVHCFETTEIEPLRFELAKQLAEMRRNDKHHEIKRLMFLPAPKTWLEREIFGIRYGYLVIERKDGDFDLFIARQSGGELIGRLEKDDPFCLWPARPLTAADYAPKSGYCMPSGHCGDVISQLVLINSPRIIGRRQHMPNQTLERKLTTRLGAGKFPLHAWTEIKLQVSKPAEIDDGGPHEAHLTGQRALHFCRAHIRIRLGRLEYVRSHWRGDPAIGIKRSRYVVTP